MELKKYWVADKETGVSLCLITAKSKDEAEKIAVKEYGECITVTGAQ